MRATASTGGRRRRGPYRNIHTRQRDPAAFFQTTYSCAFFDSPFSDSDAPETVVSSPGDLAYAFVKGAYLHRTIFEDWKFQAGVPVS